MKNIDWTKLPFGYMKTDYNIRCYYKNNAWGEIEVSNSERLDIHMAATCLHYGQEAFEGLKAFRGKDNKIRLFRWRDNAKRMQTSSRGILLAEVPEDLFGKAIYMAVQKNRKFVPPHGSGAALYIRPLILGVGAEVGVKASSEYLFLVFVSPVGPYFKEGFKPVDTMISRDHDRSAPLGTGNIKVGGNYAGSLLAMKEAHENGYANVLFLDPKEKKYIDECGACPFLNSSKKYDLSFLNLISENYRRIFEDKTNSLPLQYKRAQLLADMVSGMTDSFAIDFCNNLTRFKLSAKN